MARESPTSAYPASLGSSGSSALVAPGSRRGRMNQPSIRITSTQTAAAHSSAKKMRSPSVTKYPQGDQSENAASIGLLADLQHREECFLRNLDLADLLHALLAGLLLLEQLALARDVAAVAFCQHILAHGLDAGAGDDVAADGRLHGDVEHLARYQFLHLVDQFAAASIRVVAMHDQGQRVDRIAVDQHVELDQRSGLKMAEFVVERGVAAARGFQPVEEIEHDLGERQFILQRHLAAEE